MTDSFGEQRMDVPLSDPAQHAAAFPAEEANHKRGLLVEILTVILLAVLLMFALRVFVAQAYAISGRSMEPTLHDGEMVMMSYLSPNFFNLDRGDIVIFQSPNDSKKDLIKRVVALAGDTVRIVDDRLWVNGEEVSEDYARHGVYGRDVEEFTVETNQLYVLGDNRPHSQDSRNFGPIDLKLVKGEVFLRLWPLGDFRTLP